MRALLQHLGHDDAGEPVPRPKQALDVHALLAQAVGQLAGIHVRRAVLAEPVEWNPHPAPSKRSRNRTSPSNSIRMSGMENLAIVRRSYPPPKANPVYRSGS